MDPQELCTTAEGFRALICVARCAARIPAPPLLLSNNHTVGVGWGSRVCGGCLCIHLRVGKEEAPSVEEMEATLSRLECRLDVPFVLRLYQTSLFISLSDPSFTDLHYFL